MDKIPRHTSEVNYVSMVLHCALRAWKWSFEWTMNWFYVCLDWVLILLLLWDVLMWAWSCPTCSAEYLQSSWRHWTWPIIFYLSFKIPVLKQNLLQVYWKVNCFWFPLFYALQAAANVSMYHMVTEYLFKNYLICYVVRC